MASKCFIHNCDQFVNCTTEILITCLYIILFITQTGYFPFSTVRLQSLATAKTYLVSFKHSNNGTESLDDSMCIQHSSDKLPWVSDGNVQTGDEIKPLQSNPAFVRNFLAIIIRSVDYHCTIKHGAYDANIKWDLTKLSIKP